MAEALIRPAASGGAIVSSFDIETLDFLDSLQMDATLDETYTTSIEWSQHPRENDTNVTDNAVIQLDTVSLNGIISQTPIRGGDRSVDRLAQADEILTRIVKSRQPLQIITGLRVLDPYVATGLTINRSSTTGQAITFTLECQELVTVESRTTEVAPAPVRPDKAAAAAAKTDGGDKAPTETTEDEEVGTKDPPTDSSLALDGAKAVSSLVGG